MTTEWQTLGRRLRDAREQTGFNQEEVASLVGVSRPTLSQIEGGKVRLDSLTLRKLANLYRRPLETFFADDQPLRPALEQQVFERLNLRVAGDRVTIGHFLAFADNLAWLRDILGRKRKEPPAPHSIGPHARKYAAEVAAREERSWLGLGDAPIGEQLYELLGTLGLPVYRARLEDEHVAGLLVQHHVAGPVIFVNARQYRWRQVFTAAHEYGHFLFHRSDQPVACRIFASELESIDVTGEAFVNAFVSEFLMPENGIKRLLVEMGAAAGRLGAEEVVRLQRHFGVSFQAMLYRLLRLRLLGEADVQQLKDETRPVVVAWKLDYPVEADEFGESSDDEDDVGHRVAQRFPREYLTLALQAFEENRISNGRAAELLELNRGEFDRVYRRAKSAATQHRDENLEGVVA